MKKGSYRGNLEAASTLLVGQPVGAGTLLAGLQRAPADCVFSHPEMRVSREFFNFGVGGGAAGAVPMRAMPRLAKTLCLRNPFWRRPCGALRAWAVTLPKWKGASFFTKYESREQRVWLNKYAQSAGQ